ncbi:MAG: hypothetical protein AVDCRST_MAG17-1320 [uncultured Solirubrobacterales bacterium]|uniref:HTH tetR-type domain-containing protein n=1 Tax=uncultured Solirubrobacterales bacterium TaxID=768556 RepID=A0A6J4SM89_9ACTN|nr:MAG: hypothetical protein AVDCRST_MAG17-1320 [uncultured Solirubrobacterales bacterium]
MAEPATERGRETRDAILSSAARLFHEHGVKATSVDDVLAAAGAGKGQFYRYFASKSELVAGSVEYQIERYLDPQHQALARLDDWPELERYLIALADDHERRGFAGGCPIGSLALELSGREEDPEARLARALDAWRSSLAAGLRKLSENGHLSAAAPHDRLAAATLASIQGAYLLATVHGDRRIMDDALGEAVRHLRAHAPDHQETAQNGTD